MGSQEVSEVSFLGGGGGGTDGTDDEEVSPGGGGAGEHDPYRHAAIFPPYFA